MLVEKKLLPQAEFDRSRAQAESARRQYDIARNGAEQQYQSLLAARARMTLARKALADTVVRAPFDGVVDQRLVSVGDYVMRGTKVASVMRTTPLRVELTVPGQYISAIAVGRSVSLEVDAYPGRTFTGQDPLRLARGAGGLARAHHRGRRAQRVGRVEARTLRHGAHRTGRRRRPPCSCPAAPSAPMSGTARVYVVSPTGSAEERIVTTGQTVEDLIEITSGVKAGDVVATSNVAQLADGVRITGTR